MSSAAKLCCIQLNVLTEGAVKLANKYCQEQALAMQTEQMFLVYLASLLTTDPLF